MRKYKQPGYMDREAREKAPKAPPRPRGSGGRAAEIQIVEDQIKVTDRCRNCGTDLHTCRNCIHFDPSARNECVQPVEVRVANKSANNFCTFFEPKVLVEKQGSGAPPAARSQESHRQAFLDLFKK
ncbi:MAG: hypothetical protein H6Q06_1968 [Acidobacteria bacterium]|nr:hypothetical protein [Acidobacteriota bacterium]